MTALITGASRGVGRQLAGQMAAAGDGVIATHRGMAPPDPAIPGVEWQRLEVSDPAAQRALAQALGTRPLDLLVCNAGVYLDRGLTLADDWSPAVWQDTFAANVTGVFLTVQALLPALRRAEGAKIAIISSQMGSSERLGTAAFAYRASKAAALNLGLNLAEALRPEGIAVGIYHPGWVQTDMGGAQAAITPGESAAGLIARFGELSIETTGSFYNWDGRPHPV